MAETCVYEEKVIVINDSKKIVLVFKNFNASKL